jgi:GNAT superfamily N-acetyltransferase
MPAQETTLPEAIRPAVTPADFKAFGELVAEYVEWCRTRYRHDQTFVDEVFGYQSLSSELDSMFAAYSPPNGKTLIALRDGIVSGGVAYKDLGDGSCEMKRLFVPDRFKGQGTGRRLCAAIVATAHEDGFRLMRLDTGRLFEEAIAMYRSFGFQECRPHHEYPPPLREQLVFMELSLAAS